MRDRPAITHGDGFLQHPSGKLGAWHLDPTIGGEQQRIGEVLQRITGWELFQRESAWDHRFDAMVHTDKGATRAFVDDLKQVPAIHTRLATYSKRLG